MLPSYRKCAILIFIILTVYNGFWPVVSLLGVQNTRVFARKEIDPTSIDKRTIRMKGDVCEGRDTGLQTCSVLESECMKG